MYDITLIMPTSQFRQLLRLLPSPKQKKLGRKRCKKRSMITGILQVLRLGTRWQDIHNCGCSYSSCYRYFKELQRRGEFKLLFKALSHQKTDPTECASDTDTIWSQRFKSQVGWSGRHRLNGTKISLLSDKRGLPSDIIIESAKTHDGSFVDQHIENTQGRRKRVINLDKIYASLERRRNYRQKGIQVNMETRANDYKHKKGPKFKLNKERYKVRFLIERLFAWFENFKRLRYRVDCHISSFRAFVYLAAIIILIRN